MAVERWFVCVCVWVCVCGCVGVGVCVCAQTVLTLPEVVCPGKPRQPQQDANSCELMCHSDSALGSGGREQHEQQSSTRLSGKATGNMGIRTSRH